MKNYKKLFILLAGVILFGCTNVYAYDLEFDKAEAAVNNSVTIPVIIKTPEAVPMTIPITSCETSQENTTCSIENGIGQYNKEAKTIIGQFNEGSVVLKVKITNNNEVRLTGVTATLKYGENKSITSKGQIIPEIVKEKPKSQNAKLKSVTIQNAKPSMTPAFSQDQTEYTIYNVSDTLKSIVFDYECAEGSCNVDIEGPASVDGTKVELNVGENVVKLKSTAEDGVHSATYTFKVFKGETTFNSAKLKSIVIGDYELSPKFDKNTKEYTATVPYSLVTLATTLSYETEDPSAKAEVKGHDNLVVGENEVTIKVKNADESEEITYTIKVTRLDDQNIIIKAYKDGKITYIDSTNEKKTLDEAEFEKQYPDEYKKIKDNEYKFDEEGNIITEENKTEDTNNSTDEKKKSKTWIIVLLIVVGIIIIGVSGFFIFKKPSDKKKKKEDKNNKNGNDKLHDESEDKDNETTNENSEKNEDKTEEDLLNLADQDENNFKIKSNPDAEIAYDVEREIESVEQTAKRRNLDDTIDIDEALSDLMSTRQYNFQEEDEDK